jgi:hypothetical protein
VLSRYWRNSEPIRRRSTKWDQKKWIRRWAYNSDLSTIRIFLPLTKLEAKSKNEIFLSAISMQRACASHYKLRKIWLCREQSPFGDVTHSHRWSEAGRFE